MAFPEVKDLIRSCGKVKIWSNSRVEAEKYYVLWFNGSTRMAIVQDEFDVYGFGRRLRSKSSIVNLILFVVPTTSQHAKDVDIHLLRHSRVST